MYQGDIKDFPKEIVELMLQRQVEHGNVKWLTVFEREKESDAKVGGFDWDQTIEGRVFWVDVISFEQFDIFFKKYPKDLPLQEVLQKFAEYEGEPSFDILLSNSPKRSDLEDIFEDFYHFIKDKEYEK